MDTLAILLVVMLVLTLALDASGRARGNWARLAWEIFATLTLVLLLLGEVL